MLRSQQRFKNDRHDMYTEEINKIALSFNDDKRLIAYDGITTYPYRISAGVLCKQELLLKVKKKKNRLIILILNTNVIKSVSSFYYIFLL